MKFAAIFLGCLSLFTVQIAASLPTQVEGPSALNTKLTEVGLEQKKGLVVVFLSAVCPCSNSHLNELKTLSREFPQFNFVGVHSNVDEGKDLTERYFANVNLPFPIVQDSGARIANEFKALKTPHAFVILQDGAVAYEGGVSSSRNFDSADQKFLREALSDLAADKKVRTPEGRTLGCVISRGAKNVW